MTLNIEAADDGLSCDDELTIKGGRVNITAGGDAVKGLSGYGRYREPGYDFARQRHHLGRHALTLRQPRTAFRRTAT